MSKLLVSCSLSCDPLRNLFPKSRSFGGNAFKWPRMFFIGNIIMENEAQGSFEKPGYFPFPFPPYDIQENFMKHVYKTIESGKVGIFESPTGTVCTVLYAP